jgi:NAD(P)-dependent dehydrogenase (short-subunit alcohol dehydrogenase family)
MSLLDGKVALITGAKGGLGADVTRAFLAAGAKVAGVSRSIRQEDFPGEAFLAVPAELKSLEAARSVVATAEQQFGAVDILVHLMGGWAGGMSVAETDDATFDQMLFMNLRSSFHVIRAVLPPMQSRKQGRILAIGSKAALEPQPKSGAYNLSKAALVSLIRTVALENRNQGISANIVLPGTMDTPANRAAMLVHLASDVAGDVTGAVIPVYGPDL